MQEQLMEDDFDESEEESGGDSDCEAPRPSDKSFVAQLRDELQKNPLDTELHAALVSSLREGAQLELLQR
ncbi:unnamed protein product [Effrenium voratum]|uniref:Uncharacterized protein n=1 Tax=Effrenium voratum TaxID=2562239 RepID=A0AA36IT14_9DINO|nr:unnamed protein product [Effrenium voratum]